MLSNQHLPLGISFYDDFTRPDTYPGYIGEPPVGVPYYLAGPDLINPSDSRIYAQRWVTDPYQTTYLVQRLNKNVSNVGSKVKWVEGNGLDTDGVYVVLMCEMGNENIAWNCIHIRMTRFAIGFDVREHNQTIYTRTIAFPSILAMNKDYTFDYDFDYTRGILYYNVDDIIAGMIANKSLINRGGIFAAYEHYYNPNINTTKISVCSIWAG